MKKEYTIPEVGVTRLDMVLMKNDYSPLPPGGPGFVDEGQGMAPSRKLYI